MANRYEELIGSDDKPRDELGYLYIQFTIHTLHALMEDGVLVGDQLVMNYSPTEKNSMSDVSVSRLDFLISGFGVDCRQPKITIVMRVQSKNGDPIPIDLQTTIVSRDVTAELGDPQISCS